MPSQISIDQFLKLSERHPVIDVRTPNEFNQGHIPGACNIPLFSNEERKLVGTLYKQEGKQPAILKALELVGPRLKEIVKESINLCHEETLLVHCWRGGMRSSSVAWLLDLYGYKTYTLKGGYKSFRNYVLSVFNEPHKVVILGGRTGSGKTLILEELRKRKQQTIDLEMLANHKGSSFGSLGLNTQPSQEAFENQLCMDLNKLNAKQKIWIEDESRMVGSKVIPDNFWKQMRSSKVIYIDIPFEERVIYLVNEYGKCDKLELIRSTERIGKRLGGQHVKRAIEAIKQDDLTTACEINLAYYDKAYDFGLSKRPKENILRIQFSSLNPQKIAQEIETIPDYFS